MGRFYGGDIEGKFWFGVQSSDDISTLLNISCESNYIWKVCGCVAEINDYDYCDDCYSSKEQHIKDTVEEEEYEDDCLYMDEQNISYNIDKDDHYEELINNLKILEHHIPKTIMNEFNNIPQDDNILNAFTGVFNKVFTIFDSLELNEIQKQKIAVYTARYTLGYQIKYCLEKKDSCGVYCEC